MRFIASCSLASLPIRYRNFGLGLARPLRLGAPLQSDPFRQCLHQVSNPKPLEEPVMRAILSGMGMNPLGL